MTNKRLEAVVLFEIIRRKKDKKVDLKAKVIKPKFNKLKRENQYLMI